MHVTGLSVIAPPCWACSAASSGTCRRTARPCQRAWAPLAGLGLLTGLSCPQLARPRFKGGLSASQRDAQKIRRRKTSDEIQSIGDYGDDREFASGRSKYSARETRSQRWQQNLEDGQTSYGSDRSSPSSSQGSHRYRTTEDSHESGRSSPRNNRGGHDARGGQVWEGRHSRETSRNSSGSSHWRPSSGSASSSFDELDSGFSNQRRDSYANSSQRSDYGDSSRGHASQAEAEARARFFEAQAKVPIEISPEDPKVKQLSDEWTKAPLHKHLLAALRGRGLDRPTPSQSWSVPLMLAGKDLMVCSQTGSGKTVAYLLPLLHELLSQGSATDQRGRNGQGAVRPRGVVMAPTRELVAQIAGEASWLLKGSGIRVACIYGGVPYQETRSELRDGAELLVATPGRLEDTCSRGDVALQDVRGVVLDEADRMLDLGFEPQIRTLLTKRGMPQAGKGRQTAMFSATFGVGVQHLAADFLDAYTFVAVGRVGGAAQTVEHRLVWVEDEKKPKALLGSLLALESKAKQQPVGAVVFVNTKDAARSLEKQLMDWHFFTCSIHGDKKQDRRERALEQFRARAEGRDGRSRGSGSLAVLVATDVAARGLDIPDIACVVHYDLPSRIDDYVHRSGRTGRLGRSGEEEQTDFWKTQ
eukprot:TRINITY_DN10484_c0_g1_i1.p1 TRINITY_DN10484_c0_g1~~TRINITY_DN10484_c0_g1_i1.p1  ORF type:complete len:644 (-),score=95.29 TRINITY_DN10484_c0_g1_i1:269-2200(-)